MLREPGLGELDERSQRLREIAADLGPDLRPERVASGPVISMR
jgi:hypothetical protein